MVQIARRPADELALLLRPKERRQAAKQAEDQRQCLLRHWFSKKARGTGDNNVGLNGFGCETVVEARSRGLNPSQSAAAHNLWPRHGHFRMAAKDVGFQ